VRFYPRDVLARLHGYRYVEDHNKSVVVDGIEAVCTSMNFGANLLLNHDVGVHITGNAAHAIDAEIVSAFALAARLGPEHKDSWPSAEVASGRGASAIGYVPSGLVSNGAREAVLSALADARSSVEVEMSQLEDAAAVSGLIAAHNRGVNVRVLVDPNEINHLSPVGWAPNGVFNLGSAVRLADAGINVRWFQISNTQHALHAKCALVDGKRLLVGSTNWNSMSFDMNSETMLDVDGGAAPSRFGRTFARDWETRSATFNKDAWSLLGPRIWAYNGFAWLLN
jgi:phosphatidylserine/phosphatidylglycerophosphate/cardiolipin synthase-like enzyme